MRRFDGILSSIGRVLAALALAMALPSSAGASIMVGLGDDPLHPDGRNGIEVLGPRLGLSPDEIRQARWSTGYIYCPGRGMVPPVVASAALVFTNQVIVTNAHVFNDVIREQGEDALANCAFINQQADMPANSSTCGGDCHQRIRIDAPTLAFTRGLFDDSYMSEEAQNQDFAVVRLLAPVEGARPFAVETSGQVPVGTTIISIAAHHDGMRHRVPWTQPVVERCFVRAVFPETPGFSSHYQTDCDSGGGASGSIELIRDTDGELKIVGVFASGNIPWQRVYHYSEETYSSSVSFDGALLRSARELAHDSFGVVVGWGMERPQP